MTQGQYPTITKGMGNLTPELWRRLMTMLQSFESKNRDERRIKTSTGGSRTFLAQIRNAECIAVNRYKYSWIEVYLKDDNTVDDVSGGLSSTGDNDEWDYAAINLLEIANTATLASAGVDMSLPDYPIGYNLQLMGGGYTTSGLSEEPNADVIVYMTKIAGTSVETIPRYIFASVNEHDGECS